MNKRLSLFAIPAVCIGLVIGIAACGGSGRNHSSGTPSLEETVAAVEGAQTPAQGTFAHKQVLAYTGIGSEPVYLRISAANRADLEQTLGQAIAHDNNVPSTSTYADAIDSCDLEFGTASNDAAVIAQLNADLAAAPNNPAVPTRKGLLLLAGLEGGTAAPSQVIKAEGIFLFCQWFATRYAPSASLLVRSPCTDLCKTAYDDALKLADRIYKSTKASLDADYKAGKIDQPSYIRQFSMLQTATETLKEVAKETYDDCVADCHAQN